MSSFSYPPTPQILHWLAAGQLANRLHRSLRLWVILNKLYGEEHLATELPLSFTYAQLRDHLFSGYHPKSEYLNVAQIVASCHDLTCICHRTPLQILQKSNYQISLSEWQEVTSQLTGITSEQLQKHLQQPPFATVHRSIRDDLKQLISLKWLQTTAKGQYRTFPNSQLPIPTISSLAQTDFVQLPLTQAGELLHTLESIAFIQPNLEVIINNLWEQVAHDGSDHSTNPTSQQRIFIHLDYILSSEVQDRVDNYQAQLEQLWCKPPGGVVQFQYWIAETESKVKITVYPVCLHYRRRAKYLSAYGIDPQGNLAWHNYRLDRIASEKIQVLAWGDPEIPKPLKEMWRNGNLPTPEHIQTELADAWGFNFYLPRELLIMRFSPKFARWYVDNTFRHLSFRHIPYQQLPSLISKYLPKIEKQEVLNIIKQRDSQDVYYTGWIRTNDINVIMRLRDWRPNGEVISPWSMRERLKKEAEQELSLYLHSDFSDKVDRTVRPSGQ